MRKWTPLLLTALCCVRAKLQAKIIGFRATTTARATIRGLERGVESTIETVTVAEINQLNYTDHILFDSMTSKNLF